MKNKNKLFNMILQFLVLSLVVGYFASNMITSTFASNTDKKPNVIITINKNGSISHEGSLLGDSLLYPSNIEDAENGIGGVSGVIRISNQYARMDINNLGLGIKEEELRIGNDYPRSVVYNSFLDNVKIKIEKGVLFSFNKILTNYTSLRHLVYNPDSEEYKGFVLDSKDRFTINKGNTVDLKYTLYMSEETGKELQAVTLNMPVYINVNENVNENPIIAEYDDESNDIVTTNEPVQEEVHWAHDCIITLLNNNIIQGYPHENMSIQDYRNGKVDPVDYVSESVQPEKYITRAEAAVLVGKALGLEEQDRIIGGYLDPIPKWARGYVFATTKAGIFEGYSHSIFRLFKPNNYITREEMIAVLIRAFKVKLENENIELSFEDKDAISAWAEQYVKAGYEGGIIVGYPDNTYKPKNNITRAESFIIICKLKKLHKEHNQTN